MNNHIIRTFVSLTGVCLLLSCCSKDYLKEEQYKKLVYTMGNTDNVFQVSLKMNQEDKSLAYLPVGLSGTTTDDEDIEVTFGYDDNSISKYNILNFGFHEEKYAKALDKKHYEIEKNIAVIKAGETVGTMEIQIHPCGLSPDSIYFIPLKIDTVSKYGFNPERGNVLCQVMLENDYASQSEYTLYSSTGESSELQEPEGSTKMFSVTKLAMPTAYNQIRTTIHGYADKRDPEFIRNHSILITIKEDNSLVLEGTSPEMEVKRTGRKSFYDSSKKEFHLFYSYFNKMEKRTYVVKEVLRHI